jgi:uncharacterized protein DUF5916
VTVRWAALGGITGLIAVGPVSAQDTPSIEIGTVLRPWVVDGDLSKEQWRDAPSFTLTQQSPSPGQSTPFVTQVKLLRTQRHIYVAVASADPHPQEMAIHTLQRDADPSNDDNVTIVLDTYGDKKLAYALQVNAGGAMADGLISPGYTNLNTGSAVDYSWNGYWTAAVRRGPQGWSAEIDIDTQSLQFDSRRDKWGLNVSRYIPRGLLTLVWSGINLNASSTNPQWEGTLSGMQGASQGSGLEIDPYGLVRYADGRGGASEKAGVDIKYNLTPQLAGLVSYRTDFSEAPLDLLNVAVSPYEQPVPEARAFFLDGSNIFNFGHNLGDSFVPFYSRNIGIVSGGIVPMDGGVKVLGHLGPWTVGLLDAQMGATGTLNATNLFAGRVAYDINSQWQVGALATHGDPTGQAPNSLLAFDSTYSTSSFLGHNNLNVSAWSAHSSGDPSPGNHSGYGLDVAYPNDLWWMEFSYNFFGDALDPALGFLQRPGTKRVFVDVNYQPRPARESVLSWVRQFDPYFTLRYVTDLNDRLLSEDWHFIPLQFTTQGGWSTFLQLNPTYEVLTRPYQIIPNVILPAGDYHFTNGSVGLSTPKANSWQLTLEAEGGDLYSGHYRATNPIISWSSPGGRFSATLSPSLLYFDSHQGNGEVQAYRLSLTYSFSPTLTLSSLTQYDNLSHRWIGNTLLKWIIQPNRILYGVWNHGSTLDPNVLQGGRSQAGNNVLVKVVWGLL